MVQLLEQLDGIGWFNIVLSIVLIIMLIPIAVESWKKFKASLGLKSVSEIEEEDLEKTISDLKSQVDEYKNHRIHDRNQSLEIQKELVSAIDKITSSIEELKSDALEDKIDNMRWKILDFASQIRNGRVSYLEQFANVLKTYDDYEQLLRKHERTNGQVEESIKFIREKYHEMLSSEN